MSIPFHPPYVRGQHHVPADDDLFGPASPLSPPSNGAVPEDDELPPEVARDLRIPTQTAPQISSYHSRVYDLSDEKDHSDYDLDMLKIAKGVSSGSIVIWTRERQEKTGPHGTSGWRVLVEWSDLNVPNGKEG